MMKVLQFTKGDQPHLVEAEVVFCGEDLVIAVCGGLRYHTGAVGIAYSHPSIKNPAHKTTTSSVITIAGHKEDEIAKSAAQLISNAKNRTVTIAVGLHIDDASQEDIDRLLANFDLVIKDILDSKSL